MIKKLYFENFKGFNNSEIPIESITTLIGTNASGKTNMIEGMYILSEIMAGRDIAVVLDGTKNNSGVRGGAKGCCRFDSDYFILGCLVHYDNRVDIEYKVKIKVTDKILVCRESMSVISNNTKKHMFITREANEQSTEIEVDYYFGNASSSSISCVRSSAIISQITTKLPQSNNGKKLIVDYASYIIEKVKNILFLNPETSSMRNYSSINDTELKVNASNISSVLNYLTKDKQKENEIQDMLDKLLENEVMNMTFKKGPLNDVILFLNEKVGKKKEKIDATRLSDGTLRCLAILAAVMSVNAADVIVIEEIDNGIHPGRAAMLIKYVSALARKRGIDILFTTHNATLLNSLEKNDLTGVVIVYRDKKNGDSQFIQLVKISDMPSMLAQGKLGDVYTSDVLLQYIKEVKKKSDVSWLED